MIDFKKNKSPRYWKTIFFSLSILVIIQTVVTLFAFFLMPNIPISDVPKVSALPAKYLVIIIVGGLSKDFIAGIIVNHAYREWKKGVIL